VAQYDTPNYLGTALSGFSAGRQVGQDRRRQSALAQYASGDRAGGLSALTVEDPELAGRMQRQARDDEQYDSRKRIGGMVASGDYAGAGRAANEAGDFDAASHVSKLDAGQKALALEHVNVQAGVLASLKTYPVEMRKQAVQSIKPQLVAAGMSPEQIDAFDPSDANIDALSGQVLGLKGVLEQQLAREKLGETQRHNKAMEDRPISVGNGAMVFDRGTGEVVARNPKVFAPRAAGSAASGRSGAPVVVNEAEVEWD
jgi:hypothetical protein